MKKSSMPCRRFFSFRLIAFKISLLLTAFSCFCALTAISQATNDYRTRTNGNWNSRGTWQRYNGSSWVTASTTPNSSVGVITIRHNVTITASVTADQVTINSGDQLTVNPGITLTIANGTGTDMNVDGTLSIRGTVTVSGVIDNSSVISGAGTLTITANTTYIHSRNGGNIPTANWHTTSTCSITGVTNTVPTGLGQSFGNVEWDCASQSSDENLGAALTTVNGNFEVASTGGDNLYLTNGSSLTMNIGGDFNVSNGNLIFASGNNPAVTVNVGGSFSQTGGSIDFSDAFQIGVIALNISGDFTQSAGGFDFASGSANTSRSPAMTIGGNFSQTGSASLWTSTLDTDVINGTITFNKSGTQTFSIVTQGSLRYTNYIIVSGTTIDLNSDITLSSNSVNNWAANFTVNSGGFVNAKTNSILSAGTGLNNKFLLNSGATLITANTYGVQSGTNGAISTSIDNRTFSSGANYVYNGTSPQNSGIFTTSPTPNQVNNLTVNNTGGGNGLTLQQTMAVAGTCYFTAGRITSNTLSGLLIFNDNAVASGANNNVSNPSYVNGPVRKIGNDAFTFPVGKSNVGYMPCGISAPSNTTHAFTAEYIRNSATALGVCTAVGLYRVSACEYWQLDRTSGSSNVNVTLWWSGLNPCNAAAYVTSLSSLVVAHFNGTSWNAYGRNSSTGNASSGSVTWNNVSSFSPFSLGSTDAIQNPLPIHFSDVKAYNVPEGNKIEWKNLTEENIERYEIERSSNGTTFSFIIAAAPKSNNNQVQHYNVIDEDPLSGTNFYRVKAVEISGSFVYSAIVKVVAGNDKITSVSVYPNPVTNGQFTVQLSNYERGSYELQLINTVGEKVMTKTLQHTGGAASVSINTASSVNAGIYMLQIIGEGKRETLKLVVK